MCSSSSDNCSSGVVTIAACSGHRGAHCSRIRERIQPLGRALWGQCCSLFSDSTAVSTATAKLLYEFKASAINDCVHLLIECMLIKLYCDIGSYATLSIHCLLVVSQRQSNLHWCTRCMPLHSVLRNTLMCSCGSAYTVLRTTQTTWTASSTHWLTVSMSTHTSKAS
jgi:hypothetical protein